MSPVRLAKVYFYQIYYIVTTRSRPHERTESRLYRLLPHSQERHKITASCGFYQPAASCQQVGVILAKLCGNTTYIYLSQFKKYKTFSVLIYNYINTSGNWKNEKLCGNTTPAGRSVFTQFRVFPIFTSVDITVYQYGKNVLYFFYNIAQRTLTEVWREIFRVDIELYQHSS